MTAPKEPMTTKVTEALERIERAIGDAYTACSGNHGLAPRGWRRGHREAMSNIFDCPRGTTARLIVNLLVAIVLGAIMFALMMVILDERLSRQLDNVDPTHEEMVQSIPFAGGNK